MHPVNQAPISPATWRKNRCSITPYLCLLIFNRLNYARHSHSQSMRDCACISCLCCPSLTSPPWLILRCEQNHHCHLPVAFQPDRIRTLRYDAAWVQSPVCVFFLVQVSGCFLHICALTRTHAHTQTDRQTGWQTD